MRDLVAGSKTTATTCTWFQTKCTQFDNLSDTQKSCLKVVVSIAAVSVLSYTASYLSTTILTSQASEACGSLLKKKRKYTLYQAIQAGIVRAVFTYDGIDDTHHGTQTFTGPFRGNLQYGSFFDTISKEWDTCWRRIVRLNIDGEVIKVPRALLSALADCSILIRDGDKLAVNTVGLRGPLADRHVGLHQVLDSQSGVRAYMTSKKRSDLPMSEEQPKLNTGGFPSVVVDAGAHHSARMRASKPSDSAWSMDRIFKDTNTVNADIKFLKAKFADQQRNHFAATGSVTCDARQVTPLQALLKEMKITVPSSDGIANQEVVQTASVSEDDDIGV